MPRHIAFTLGLWLALASLNPSFAIALDAQKKNKADAAQQLSDATASPVESPEIKMALMRLPIAAALGMVLAFRPRRRSQGQRVVVVMQTQIMLAVVGTVIMLVVGNSLSRAFGIVGAAGLVRYRSTIDDPKEAVVMLCAVGAGLASGVGLYVLAPFATVFMAAVLWLVEYFEPAARKQFELNLTMKNVLDFRPKAESVLRGLQLEYELLAENDELVSYS